MPSPSDNRPWRKLYGRRWAHASRSYLGANPLCVICAAQGRLQAAHVTDHKVPHRGDAALFWNADNWQALCKRCHDGDKQREERQTADLEARAVDAEGYPINGDW